MTLPASLARAVARREPKAIAIVFIDKDGKHHTVWHCDTGMLALVGGASSLSQELAWNLVQQSSKKLLPRRRRK